MKTSRLPSGELVHNEPPSQAFPEGRQKLMPGPSRLRKRLAAGLEDKLARQEELRARAAAKLQRKQASMAAHPEVPGSKRHV